MAFDITGLLDLWADPASDRAAFARWYADPVTINGEPLTLDDLVARAAEVRASYPDATREVLDVLDGSGKVAVAFRLGPHRVIDLITHTDGLITRIWMAATPENTVEQAFE